MTEPGNPENDYVIRVCAEPLSLDGAAWDRLLEAQAVPTPFMRYAYLAAMHLSGSAAPGTGWTPQFMTVHDSGKLVGAAALYLKTHSYGEYVFDWAWADAYHRHGLHYYPKLLGAVPFTPVPGSRLLAQDPAVRDLLARAITALAKRDARSSAHVLFVDDADRAAFERAGWMIREGVQFHWTRDPALTTACFDDVLARMQRHKRKNIVQERRRVAEAGVTFVALEGAEIDAALWDFFHHCYTLTYRAHGSSPYLTRAFFAEMARTMPEHWVMFVASRGGQRIAASLIAVDTRRGCAWGRYWGCTEHVPCLHFDACYYQPLAWCIARGFDRFEGGAQGEHKMARGLLPVKTASAHWLRDERFASAVADFLSREGDGVDAYVDELRERNPFRPTSGSPN
jgi:uncharacterized protein